MYVLIAVPLRSYWQPLIIMVAQPLAIIGAIPAERKKDEAVVLMGSGLDDVDGEAYLDAYAPILRRRAGMDHGERERRWQLLRRGRYVEFNLLQDRGTRFGLEAGGRVESILASLPPLVRWEYDARPEPGSAEARLLDEFLVPRDWLAAG